MGWSLDQCYNFLRPSLFVKLECLSLSVTYIIVSKEPNIVAPYKGPLSPARKHKTRVAVTNTLAYYDTELIMTLKKVYRAKLLESISCRNVGVNLPLGKLDRFTVFKIKRI